MCYECSTCGHEHLNTGAWRGQRHQILLELLKWQSVISWMTLVLATEVRSSARNIHVLNLQRIFTLWKLMSLKYSIGGCACGVLNESILYRLRYLNAWSPVLVKEVMEPSGGRAFLEEVCHSGQILCVDSLSLILVHSLCLMFTFADISSQLAAPATMPTPCHLTCLPSKKDS